VDLVYSFLVGVALVSSAVAAFRFARPRRVLSPQGSAMEAALHAASATLPHLRRGLSRPSASKAAPHLLRLTGAAAIAIADDRTVLAFVGGGRDHHRAGDEAASLLGPDGDAQRTRIVETPCDRDGCPVTVAVVAPLVVRERRVGSLAALYADRGDVRPADVRVVEEAATLVSAQLELAELESQGERLVRAELLALRAQISPHFVYNALAAVANSIHTKPEEARELLGDFAEFMRYAFRPEQPYVTLRDELAYVDHYLRLEQARFGDRLSVRVEVAPEVLGAVVPVLSLQPLVENAVRHGLERREGKGHLVITGIDLDTEVELRVTDDGAGMSAEQAQAALEGRGPGIGLANVHSRVHNAFGEGYGLEIERAPGGGTSVRMTLPKFRPGVRAA
jgi:two-component system, LytTR family, sensor kinase